MSGILHVIEQLGSAHQAALGEIERLGKENDELRALLAAKEGTAPPTGGQAHLYDPPRPGKRSV